jgi:hypothetical protein
MAGMLLGSACGGAKTQMITSPDMSQTDVVVPGLRGTVVDYFSDMPLAGLTVVDGDNTTTTDANGNFELPTTGPLAPVVSGPMYTTLYLPQATPGSVEIEHGSIPIPSAQGLALEQQLLSTDSTKALVQVTVVQAPTCASIAGGTITVVSPADAKVAYFTTQKLPTGSSFVDGITGHRPVAVIYDLEPGAPLEVEVNTPNCTQVPPNTPFDHTSLTGNVTTAPLEPGDNNSSIVYFVE